jgi:hypothetical protein
VPQVTLPFCTVLLLLAWAFVIAWIQPNDVLFIPPITGPKRFFGIPEYAVIIASLVTVFPHLPCCALTS